MLSKIEELTKLLEQKTNELNTTKDQIIENQKAYKKQINESYSKLDQKTNQLNEL